MHHLTRTELKDLLNNTKKPQHRLMLLVAFHHGLRVSEVINLTGRDIRDGYIDVKRLKGSLRTRQPYVCHPDPELDESIELNNLSNTLGDKDRLFPITRFGAYKLMQKAGKEAKVARHKCHPHALKHSIAMQTIEKVGIHRVCAHLGHKSIASTGHYLRVDPEQASREIAAAV